MAVDNTWVTSRPVMRLAGARRALGALYRLIERSPARVLLQLPAVEQARRRATATTMSGADTVEMIGILSAAGIPSWLSGGWGCDALLGEQTRLHADIDIVVDKANRPAAITLLERHGFVPSVSFEADLRVSVVELIDRGRRRRIGLHFVDADANGSAGWRAVLGAAIPAIGIDADGLFTTGTVAGHELPCLSAAALLALHTGYEPTNTDRQDVRRLCARFALPAPPGYASLPDVA